MADLLTFTLVFIPMAILIGIASATIGFTAWNIAVPLVFMGFGFGIFEALFLSIILDLVDGIYLTIRYSKDGKVEYKEGLKWSVFSLIGAFVASLFTHDLIQNNTHILQGGVGYLIFIIGAAFIYKGYKLGHQPPDQEVQKESIQSRIPKWLVMGIMIFGMIISGAFGGLLGMGSGMNFVLLFILVLGFDTLLATGTGCFMMAILMTFAAIRFIGWVDLAILWPFLLIATVFALGGTMLGAKYALKLPNDKLNYMVGAAMIIAAAVATIQSFFL